MKFALIGPAPPFRGGIAQYTAALHQNLKRGHSAILISFKRQYPSFFFPGTTQFDRSEETIGEMGESLFDPLDPFSARKVALRIRSEQPDAVIFQWWHPFFAPGYRAIAKRLGGYRDLAILFLCHNVLPHERPGGDLLLPLFRMLTRRVFRYVDGFLVHSTDLAREIERLKPGAEVRRIYHPSYDFYSKWDPGPQPRNATPNLLFFGTVREYKGLDTLIEALVLLGEELDFTVTIAGESYVDTSSLRHQLAVSGLSRRVRWIDRYIPNEEVATLFRKADLVVLPYRRATQSGVIPLAYYFEVPVIATDVGGLAEVVADERTGFLVPPDDSRALAAGIRRYLKVSDRAEFKRHVRDFQRHLSWNQVVDNILRLTDSVQCRNALHTGSDSQVEPRE